MSPAPATLATLTPLAACGLVALAATERRAGAQRLAAVHRVS